MKKLILQSLAIIAVNISVPLYFVLERMGKLNRAKRVVARLKNRKAVAVIAGIVLCMLAIGFARYVDFPALRHGVPGTSALKHSLKDMDLALGSSRYYCLGSFIDSEWLWRHGTPKTMYSTCG